MCKHSAVFVDAWRFAFSRCYCSGARAGSAFGSASLHSEPNVCCAGRFRASAMREAIIASQKPKFVLATHDRSYRVRPRLPGRNGPIATSSSSRSEREVIAATSTFSNERTIVLHEHYMRMALALAEEAYHNNEVPVGAVLVLHGRPETGSPDVVLARGRNRTEERCDATAHAEMECLRMASSGLQTWRLNRAGSRECPAPREVTLYCTLEPCAMCLSAMQLARVTRLVYGAPGLRLGAVASYVPLLAMAPPHPFHRFSKVVPGVLATESAFLLRRFFQERRNRIRVSGHFARHESKSLCCQESALAASRYAESSDE
ncbi:hypothetical protein F1559_001466 [Cyanidiococcus yangmingshanensis]|uniref:tRNA(adenine(34)) deaminase n=1 Tax=Cyanidiococcus yangmingshanensis TaxID=2690220 RepID=A0A7J7IJF4_9RHOD|nr:hypothetical protein F1559_001466 [Cyanidiococcus yangmingshanensis]